MSIFQPQATTTQIAVNDNFACLETPVLHGFAKMRAFLVDRIKQAAIRLLHKNIYGERWLLRMYLIGEETTECALHEEWSKQPLESWLAQRVEQHLADERCHATAFANELRKRGISTNMRHAPDWLSQRKIAQWRRLALRYAPCFSQGILVPAYATGLCAEQMAMRVLTRHCSTIGATHPLYPLLARVLNDESRHVRLCADTLRHLVPPSETAHLVALLNEIRAIEAAFGFTGAVAMYITGCAMVLLPSRNTLEAKI